MPFNSYLLDSTLIAFWSDVSLLSVGSDICLSLKITIFLHSETLQMLNFSQTHCSLQAAWLLCSLSYL